MAISRSTVNAYFTMEAALESEMPTYSGGLGVLAGDTLRAAADLGVNLVAVTLLYRQGFFTQRIDANGRQTEVRPEWDPRSFLRPVDVRVRLTIEGRPVSVGAWQFTVHGARGNEVPVYLLDTDLLENDPSDRALTGQLYGGDQRYRLRQEAVLGLGGVAVLRALGYDQIETFHMNEGHCSLLTLAILDECSEKGVIEATSEEIAATREHCIFTTHTPVPAGHDRFSMDLVHQVLGYPWAQAIERLPLNGELNMTHLGLFLSRYANAVAWRHGETARAMYPQYHIHSITNGVHAGTWASEPIAALLDRELPQWRFDNNYLRQAITIPIQAIQDAHAIAKRNLVVEIQRRTGVDLDPEVMTIGFARRAATYKRADLVFSDIERLTEIVETAGPLQFVFAGKAHPHDEGGKALIQRVIEAGGRLGKTVPVVYLEDHDMALGKLLYAGVDLWLNNPQKPMEASGTSGMKAALNGVPSLSVLDGWWPEGWIEGVTGWRIGGDLAEPSDAEAEAESLYTKLCDVIVPLYYKNPGAYAEIMRSTMALNGAYFTSQRMVEQYIENAYRPQNEGRV